MKQQSLTVFFSILMFIPIDFAVMADVRVDSLRAALTSSEGRTRVDILNDLAKGLKYADISEAKRYSHQAADLAQSLQYDEGTIMAWIIQASIANNQNDSGKAKELLQQAIRLGQETEYSYGLAYANLSMTVLHIHLNKYDSAIRNAFDGLKASRNIGNPDLEIANLINIGAIKQMTQDWEGAAKYLTEARAVAEEHNFQSRLGQIYGNLAMVAFNRNNIGEAIDYHRLSLAIFRSTSMRQQEAKTLHNLGIAFAKIGEDEQSLTHFDQALQLRQQLNDQLSAARTLRHMGDLMVKQGKTDQGINYLNEAKNIAQGYENFNLSKDIYYSLFEAYQKTSDLPSAIENLQAFIRMKDSVSVRSNAKTVAQLTATFEFERLENINKLQQQESEQQDLIIAQRNWLILIISVGIVLIIIISLWGRYLLKNRLEHSQKDKMIAEKETEIVSQTLNSDKVDLIHFAEQLLRQNRELEEKKSQLELEVSSDIKETRKIDELVEKLRNAITDQKDWTAFRLYFDKAYPGLYEEIKAAKGVELTLSERRLIALIKIGLSNKEIGSILGISRNSVVRANYRLKQKMGFDDTKGLENFVLNL